MAGVDRLLEGLSEDQIAAVTTDAAPLCIVASAGSGKTRVLTRRVAWRARTERLDPRHALVLTFTRKAATELRERLDHLGLRDGVAAGTFHAIAYAQLRARWADRGVRPPTLTDRRAALFARHLPRADPPTLYDALNELDWARARLVEPEDYPAAAAATGRRRSTPPDRLAEAFEGYREEKRRRRVVDFDDLLTLAARDLTADPEYAAAQRWRFRHLFVDEFQDLNPLQQRLLDAWLGGRDDLCVVGDPDQAIYGWNGADAATLIGFDDHYPGATVLTLDDNFRSSPEIVAAAAKVRGAGRRSGPAHGPAGEQPCVRCHADDRAEAAAVARAVRDGHAPGDAWSSQAVLVRTHAQTALLQEAFAAAGIPYRVRGGCSFLEHPTVASALDRLARSRGLLVDDLTDLDDHVDPAATGPRVADALEHLDAIRRLARDHLRLDPSATTVAFVELLTAQVGEPVDTATDAVDIVTFHAAKGLEWPTVHLAGLEAGLVPIAHATTPAAAAEERRLLYVAMTRARQRLTLHWAAQRSFGNVVVERERSPLLQPLVSPSNLAGQPSPPLARIPRPPREHLGSTSARDEVDDPVLTRLQTWRSRAAQRAGVEPRHVIDDLTLAAIAEQRPASEADLVRIAGLSPVRRARYGSRVLELIRTPHPTSVAQPHR